jgi:hypothetical protein
MRPLQTLAKLLRIREDQAEDALYNARAAKLVLSRRSFIGVGAALTTGAAFGFYKQFGYLPWNDPSKLYVYLEDDNGNMYERVAVQRDELHWKVQQGRVSTTKPICFPAESSGRDMRCTQLRILMADGHQLATGRLNCEVRITNGVTPMIGIEGISLERLYLSGIVAGA